MFTEREKPRYQRMLESEIERTISGLKMTPLVDSTEYEKQLAIAERLHKLMDHEEKTSPVSKETMATVAANLLGIIMIIKHESVNVLTSKALSFVIRPR